MTIDPELLAAIESPRLSARLNVVSGYRQFVRGLTSQPEIRKLLGQVRSPDDSLALFLRVLNILRAPYDPSYEHPSDVALAAYLWILRMTDPEVAFLAADLVRECPGCWWVRMLAQELLAARKAMVESHRSATVVVREPPVKMSARHSIDLGLVYLGSYPGSGESSPRMKGAAHHGRTSAFDVVFRGGKPTPRNRGSGNRHNRQSFEAVA